MAWPQPPPNMMYPPIPVSVAAMPSMAMMAPPIRFPVAAAVPTMDETTTTPTTSSTNQPIDKTKTAFIGRIPASVSDDTLAEMLSLCGPLQRWTRVAHIDPTLGVLPFGFATFESAASLHALLHAIARERRAEPGAPLKPHPLTLAHGEPQLIVKVDVGARRAIVDWMTKEGLDAKLRVETEVEPRIEAFLRDTLRVQNPAPFDSSTAPSDQDNAMQDVQQSSNGVATAPAETTSSDVDAFLTQITKEEEEALHILENEEDEIKRLERREREMHQAYLERVARFERTEQTRIHKIEAALTAQQERRAKRVRDADTQRHALLDYDDDLEREKGEHEYYRERSRWIRQRVAHARREMDKDAEDRRAEAHEAALAARAAYEATRAEREAAAKARAEEEARLAALRAEEERLERLRREREEQRREVYHAVASGGHGIVVGRIMTMEERKAAIQELVAQLPTEWEAICVWDVKWDFLEGGGDVLQGKLKEFVGKKVVETLKEENADIVDFVMKSVGRRKGAQYLLDELSGPLEEDAEIFVKKLWRMVMFESESRARGLA